MIEERKTAPIELHYCFQRQRGKESGGEEERIMGLMPADKQHWCWGLITHTLTRWLSLGRKLGGKSVFDLRLIH